MPLTQGALTNQRKGISHLTSQAITESRSSSGCGRKALRSSRMRKSVLIPNSLYFIGLFLCQDDRTNFPHKGPYFHASGRFVCWANLSRIKPSLPSSTSIVP
jgi:hypothetical protein